MSARTLTRTFALLPVLGFTLTSCGLSQGTDTTGSPSQDDKTITMIVTESAPYQEPTKIVQEKLAEQGWELDTAYVTDIVLPNNAVEQGEYDVNFFQHQAYLEQFNADNGTTAEPVFSVYYGQSGFFSTSVDSLEDLPQGAEIAIPVDTTNNGRALHLLAENGIIEVAEDIEPTRLSQRDITANPKNLRFVEVDQQSLGHTLSDVDAGFVFVRQIAEAGHSVDDTVLVLEEDEAIQRSFTVVVASLPEFRDTEAARVLQEAYQSEEVAQWYADYEGGVVQYRDDITVDNAAEVWAEFTQE